MEKVERGADALDYAPCNYGASRLICRGPRCDLDGDDYIAVLGGIETFGQFVERPYPARLEAALGMPCINLAAVNSGPDAWMGDQTVMDLARGARLTVIAVPGAHMLRNKFYTVHSRRNDRVVRQSEFMRRVFPELDLSQNFFVRHLLNDLFEASERRFAVVRDELQKLWVTRMNQLTARIGGDVILVWIGDRSPDDPTDTVCDGDPPFVTRAMLRSLRGRIRATIEVLDQSSTMEEALEGKHFAPDERDAALRVPGPRAHQNIADALRDAIAPLIGDEPDILSQLAQRTA
ncbi:hypothetical protein ILP92_12585 [Maribius pontilimi]|uniref:DUF6473 domain-containing protein n=1 Tax=Palleronia pontilimi TaxID=1964209 RepID=A0A934IHQ8_9RHOB|nr:DUF6473 family protein [Palleronia pontilimi]MBJ3763585.1 hypothetical protein [Palleronia pontilimi]